MRVRNYYFDRDNSPNDDRIAWAMGGWLDYRSGWAFDRFRLGVNWYTSQRLYGPEDKGGTLLLKPVQTGFGILGQAFAELKLFKGTRFRGFRQAFNYPYLNRRDSRMVPVTFEAYAVKHETGSDFDWIAGHVTKIKTRASDQFVYMSEAAGFDDTDDGLSMAGMRYNFSEYNNVGLINYYSWNVMNTLYMEGNAIWQASEAVPVRFSAQYTDQRSVGAAYRGAFNTYSVGAQVSASYHGAILTLAGTTTGNGDGIFKPYGGSPSYLSKMVKSFDRAGEDAWSVGLSYDFALVDGLSAFTTYVRGYTPNSGPNASPDQEEWDITVDYRPTKGLLEGLWLRLRRAEVNQQGPDSNDNDSVDYRVIVNFDIDFL